jgi:hypothetical protein
MSSLHLYSGQWTVPTTPLSRWHPLNFPFTATWLCQQVTWCIGNPCANDVKASLIMTNLCKNMHWVLHKYSVGKTLSVNLPNPLLVPTNWLMWHANMSMVPSWLIWITLMKHSTLGDWFCLNLANPLRMQSVIPHASLQYFPFGNYDSHIQVIPAHAKLLRKSIHLFTNTCHSLQHYHLSFSTKKECIFACNTLGNIEWLPIYPFATLSLSQSRNDHIYFSLHSFHSTLISTSLSNSICQHKLPYGICY